MNGTEGTGKERCPYVISENWFKVGVLGPRTQRVHRGEPHGTGRGTVETHIV